MLLLSSVLSSPLFNSITLKPFPLTDSSLPTAKCQMLTATSYPQSLTDNVKILSSQSRRRSCSESSPFERSSLCAASQSLSSSPLERPSLCATSQSSPSSLSERPSLCATSQPSPIFTDLRASALSFGK
ncbi:uncharacterized protein DS421_6g191510 [Arachis hypogaea]|nr:uncharacterized protein DS421_6g191510 [Arachis hypogaea]